MSKAIITAAITGSIHTPTMSPHLPITPKEIANEAMRAYEAGAAVAHIHVRDPQTGAPSVSVDLFREVITDIKSRCNMVLCLSTGAGLGMTAEPRAVSVRAFNRNWPRSTSVPSTSPCFHSSPGTRNGSSPGNLSISA